jgi:hypothetical protein
MKTKNIRQLTRKRPKLTASGNWACIFCQVKNEIHFDVPKFMGTSITDVTCIDCQSRFRLKFKKTDTHTEANFHQWVSVLFKSEKAFEIEKSKPKAKPSNSSTKNPYDRMG